MQKAKPTIYTLGHSNKPLQTPLDALKKHKIRVVADVRSIPASRYCPHFNRNALHSELAKRDIQYLWYGQNLGGRGVKVGWDDAIATLAGIPKKGARIALMCSEADYRKCHRYTTLTPAFEAAGLRVVHVQYSTSKTSIKSPHKTLKNPKKTLR